MRIIVDTTGKRTLERFALRPPMFSTDDDDSVMAIGNLIIKAWQNYYASDDSDAAEGNGISESERAMIVKRMDEESARVICEVKWRNRRIEVDIWIKAKAKRKDETRDLTVKTSNSAVEVCKWFEVTAETIVSQMDDKVRNNFKVSNFVYEENRKKVRS